MAENCELAHIYSKIFNGKLTFYTVSRGLFTDDWFEVKSVNIEDNCDDLVESSIDENDDDCEDEPVVA